MSSRRRHSVGRAWYSGGCLFFVSVLFATSSATASYVLIDNFESYSLGNSGSTGSDAFASKGGPWQPRDISGDVSSSLLGINAGKYLYFAEAGSTRSGYRAVTPIAQGARGIYYFQVQTTDATPYASYGLSDQATATVAGYADLEAYVTLYDADGAGVSGFNLVGRDGGADVTLASGLANNTWYDIWLVVDNAADTYDVYFGATGDPEVMGVKVGSGLAFRNGTAANDLGTFMTMDDDGSISLRASGRLDNIYYSPVVRKGTMISIL